MYFVLFGMPALIGFMFGYFLAKSVLIMITVLCCIIVSLMFITLTELASLIALIVLIMSVIGNMVMWVTYRLVNKSLN